MNKDAEKILTKKIALIYEYNKKTPLFVRVAKRELDLQNVQHAIDIIQSGLELFPDNPTALLLLGKAYALNGNYETAMEYFRQGSELIDCSATLDFYKNEIETLKKQRTLTETVRSNVFSEYKAEDVNIKPETENEKIDEDKQSIAKFTESIDEKLDQLAKEISKAKISIASQSDITDSEFLSKISGDNLIISETLAKIYLAQEEYNEAIQVYEKLIKKEPARYEYFTEKINEIRAKMKT